MLRCQPRTRWIFFEIYQNFLKIFPCIFHIWMHHHLAAVQGLVLEVGVSREGTGVVWESVALSSSDIGSAKSVRVVF